MGRAGLMADHLAGATPCRCACGEVVSVKVILRGLTFDVQCFDPSTGWRIEACGKCRGRLPMTLRIADCEREHWGQERKGHG